MQEVAIKMAELGTKQDYLTQQTEHNRLDVASRLDTGFNAISVAQEKMLNRMEEHEVAFQAAVKRFDPLEAHVNAEEARAKTSRENWRNVGLGLLLAGAGVFVTKFVEHFWSKV